MPEIELQLLRQNLDLAICAHPPRSEKLHYELLSQCPYVLTCSIENSLAQKRRIFLRQAAEENFICENSRLSRKRVEDVCGNCGFVPHISHEVESGYILHDLLEENVGVALIPLAHYLKINAHFPKHHLQIVFLKDDLPLAEIGVMYFQDRMLPAAAAQFLAFLHQCAADEKNMIQTFKEALDFAI